MASEQLEGFLGMLPASMVSGEDSLEVAQQKLEAMHGHAIEADTQVEWTQLGGVRCAWVDVAEARGSDRVLVLCHGGAWVAAGGDGYLFYAEMLGKPCRSRVLLVDYRLAPEHRHPAASQDIAAAYRALIDEGQDPSRVGFIGDSCGGGLAISALLQLRDAGVALPALAVTLGGWFDLEADSPSARESIGRDPFTHPEFTRARARDYLGPQGDPRAPLASVVHADLRGLPPLLVQAGEVDITRDEAILLAEHAERDGVDVNLEIDPEMIHGYQGLARAGIPEAIAALDRVGEFLSARIP